MLLYYIMLCLSSYAILCYILEAGLLKNSVYIIFYSTSLKKFWNFYYAALSLTT